MSSRPARRFLAAALIGAALAVTIQAASAQSSGGAGCDGSIAGAQDTARLNFISGRSSLANQMFSPRPASFAQMTCLEKLFSFGQQSMDILFQPPGMSSLLGMIQNFACQSMSQYLGKAGNGFSSMLGSAFGGLGGGSGSGGGVGQIIPGVNIGSLMSGQINGLAMQGSNSFNNVSMSPMSLFSGLGGGQVNIPGGTSSIGQIMNAWQR